MKFQGITGNFTEANVEALAVAVFKGEKGTSGVLKDLDKLKASLAEDDKQLAQRDKQLAQLEKRCLELEQEYNALKKDEPGYEQKSKKIMKELDEIVQKAKKL